MNRTISYQVTKFKCLSPCQEVNLCLSPEWADKTVSGSTIIPAITQASGRPMNWMSIFSYMNLRRDPQYQFCFTVDDALFQVDPETDKPFLPKCGDILEIIDSPCELASTATKVKTAIKTK